MHNYLYHKMYHNPSVDNKLHCGSILTNQGSRRFWTKASRFRNIWTSVPLDLMYLGIYHYNC